MSSTGEVFGTAATTAAETPWLDNDWTTPTNVLANDGATASITATTFDTGDQSFVLKVTGFNFSSIPDDAVIQGVTVRVDSFFRSGQGSGSIDLAQLLDTLSLRVGDNKAASLVPLTTTSTVYTFGSAVDVWGAALTPAWIKSSSFGVALGIRATAANADVDIDYVTIEVEWSELIVMDFLPGVSGVM